MSAPAVVPAPRVITPLEGAPFLLRPDVAVTGDSDAAAALRELVAARTGGPSTGSGTEGASPSTGSGTEGGIAVRVSAGGAPESYTLEVTAASVTIVGADAAGLFYGIQTLGQLIAAEHGAWIVPAVRIDDAPRFAYRGVMLDVARHFHGVDTVTAYIDRAASLKFNHLHLHLSDDQGWRLEITSRPHLTGLASGTSVGGGAGGFFTQDDFRGIVAYAAARHMTVVPEFDMPSHTHAVSLAYPELAEAPVISDEIRDAETPFGGGMPAVGRPYTGIAVGFSSLKTRDEATYAFVHDVLSEIAALTPGPYLHVGGDEALGTASDDFAIFMERVTEMVAELGKTPIAWHEAGSAARLAPSTIGQYWGYVEPTDGMDEKARTFVRNGSRVILSPADAIYLDMKFAATSPLGLTWARGVTSAQRAYEWEPSTLIAGIGEDDILGVEAPMWSESSRSLADLDALAFPRIAAAAEAAWSPAVGAHPERTWDSFRVRVGALAPLWTSLGIGFTPLEGVAWQAEGGGAR